MKIDYRFSAMVVSLLAGSYETCFLDAFDLSHTSIMDSDLNGAVAEICHVFTNNFQPVSLGIVLARMFRGDGCHWSPV